MCWYLAGGCLLVIALLNSWRCRFAEAASAAEALAKLQEAAQAGDPFQVALLDMQMPEVDGAELGRWIKDCPEISQTPLVMMTSMGRRGDAAWFQTPALWCMAGEVDNAVGMGRQIKPGCGLARKSKLQGTAVVVTWVFHAQSESGRFAGKYRFGT